MKPYWDYTKINSNKSLSRKPPRLKDLGTHDIKTFVRELIQNCLDARFNASLPVEIKITIKEWGKNEIQNFLNLLGEDHIALLKKSYEVALPEVKVHMKDGYDIICGNRNRTFCLIVEEKNCIGLIGSEDGADESSHFNALLRQNDNNENKRFSNSGGTWGKGSSIFTFISKMWTWFCYTKLSTPWINKEDNVIHEKRFMGRCMIAPFYDKPNNKSYQGDCWFCRPNTEAFPYLNSEADSFAELFELENRNEPGCTFLIPILNPLGDNIESSEPDLQEVFSEFRIQVLQNWFIPIFNSQLKVSVQIENKSIQIDKEYLEKKVPELKFKLAILKWYQEGCPPDKRFVNETIEVEVPALKKEYLDKETQFANEKERVKLDLVIRILTEDEEHGNKWETKNTVALTRNKGMIITNYDDSLKFFENSTDFRIESILFAGLLSRGEMNLNKRRHLDLYLACSENPPHNNWATSDKVLSYLEFFEGKRPDKTVRDIFDRIYGAFKELFKEDRAQPTHKDICSIFKKLARLKIAGDETTGKALYYMRTPDAVNNPQIVDGLYNYEFKFIHSESQPENVRIDFKSFIESLEGETNKDFDNLGIPEFENIELFDRSGNKIDSGKNPSILLGYGESLTVRIRTCNIDSNSRFKNLKPIIKTSGKTEVAL